MNIHQLPALNAGLNAVAGLCLLFGRRAIKQGKPKLHRVWMLGALGSSAIFLSSYLYYHTHVRLITHYAGHGLLRAVYFFILATHVPLAALMLPFIIMAVVYALRGQFDKHTAITRRLWPVWLYVSVTGVLVYLLLYQLPQS